MEKKYPTATNTLGRALAGANVTVYTAMGALATLYADNETTTLSNPLTTDPLGTTAYKAVDGMYSWVITHPDIQTLTRTGILHEDLTALSASSGASQVGYQLASNSQLRTVQDRLRDEVSVFDFMTAAQLADVKAGTNLVDVSGAWLNALATGRPVFAPHQGGWSHRFGVTLIVPSGASIRSNGASILLAAGVNNHVMRIADGADNVQISGLRIDGNRANNIGGHGIAIGGVGATNLRILDNYITNCSANGIYFGGTAVVHVTARGNSVNNCFSAGITADATVSAFAFNDNQCWMNGTHGVGIIGVAKNGNIVGNVCGDNGQNTPTADNITGYNALNDNIVVAGNTTYGGLNNGIHMGGSRITMTGNTAYGPTQYGLVLRADAGGSCSDCVISGNISFNAGVSGFWTDTCTNTTISGNTARGSAGNGYAIDNCNFCAYTGNTARGNTQCGFKTATASSFLTFSGNIATANGSDGFDLTNLADATITGNIFSSNTGWGINRGGASTDARNLIASNKTRANTAGQIAPMPITTRVDGNQTNLTRTVASANTLTLPTDGQYFYIIGTLGIMSITASWPDRRVTFQFDDVTTVFDGNNLILAGNFVTTYQDTITLVSDGSNWIECSRSVN